MSEPRTQVRQTQPVTTGARAPSVGLGFYSSDECLHGWRSYLTRQSQGNEESVRMDNPDPARLGKERRGHSGGDGLDRGFAMWLHVETFWDKHFALHTHKPFAVMGIDRGWRQTFDDWYAANPLRKSYVHPDCKPDAGGTREYDEMAWLPLREAIERYNVLNPKCRSIQYNTALKAIHQDRLVASRPSGKWHTTLDDLRRWQEADLRKSEKSRDEAA